jgi:hypothetical protein
VVSVWTEFGPVYALSGPDIFLKTMDSKTFISYLHGDLSAAFISSPREAQSRLEKIADKVTFDGRYGIEEFRCRGHVWQTVFEGLLTRCDAAVLDLRGFDRQRLGTAYELFTIVRENHHGKVLFLADETTSMSFLQEVVGAAAGAVAAAPQARTDTVKISVTDVTGLRRQVAHRVLPLLTQRAAERQVVGSESWHSPGEITRE